MATKKHPSSVYNAAFLNALKDADYTVHCVVTHVSRSGMLRRFKVWIQTSDQHELYPRGLHIRGAGWDQSFDIVADYLREFTSQPVNVSGWGQPRPGDLRVQRVIHDAWC